MRSIGILGPFGSGKTTLLADVAGSLHQGGALVRAVINDVLAGRADAERVARTRAQFDFLSGGCIGCQDRESFLRAVREARADGMEYFVFEQPGVTHGHELAGALRDILPPEDAMRFVCLWDASPDRHAHNSSLPIISTSLRVADIVGVTKAWSDLRTLPDDVLLHLATESAAPIVMIPRDGSVGSAFVERLFSVGGVGVVPSFPGFRTPSACGVPGHSHGPACGITHSSESALGEIRGVRLRPHDDTSVADLEEFVRRYADGVERAKGIVPDEAGSLRYVQYVPGSALDASERAPTGSVPELLIYCRDAATLAAGSTLGRPVVADDLSATDAKTLMARISDDVPESVLVSHARYLLSLYPANIEGGADGIPPADFGDADLAYQLAKNPRMPEWVRQETHRLWIGKRLESLRMMRDTGTIDAYALRRLGANLTWHAGQPERFLVSPEMRDDVWALAPARALAGWLLAVEVPTFRDEAAEERPEFVGEAFGYALDYETDFSSTLAARACEHMAGRCEAHGRRDWAERWKRVLAAFEA